MVAIDSLKKNNQEAQSGTIGFFFLRIYTYPCVPLLNTFAVIKVLLFHILHFYD